MNGPSYRINGLSEGKYRERSRCEHRTISLFCAIQCWKNGWDGIRISRSQLKELLNLEKLRKKSRIEKIKQDFEELFPFQRPDYPSPWLEFSRRAFDEQPVIEECRIPERPNSDNKFGLLDELLLPTFNDAILDILMHHMINNK